MTGSELAGEDGVALLEDEFFEGPGEALWSPLELDSWPPFALGDEPDGWDAPDEGIVFCASESRATGEPGRHAAADAERFRDPIGGPALDAASGDGRFRAAPANGGLGSEPDGVPGEGCAGREDGAVGRCRKLRPLADGGFRPDGPDGVPGEGCAGWLDGSGGRPGCADSDGGFGPGGPVEAMPADSLLHALTERAVVGGLAGMSDGGVVGVIAAARRLRSHAELLEVQATREFAHRRWESSAGPERDKNGRWLFKGRDAEFAADELAFELVEAPLAAQQRMDLSLALRDRLPGLGSRLGAGVDLHRCRIVHEVTEALSDEHARQVDALLAPEAAGLRYDALRRQARKLAMMADPESERERRERATRTKARVEAFPEGSGNYAIAGRELPVGEVLASRAYIRAVALELRTGGVKGSLRELDLMVFLDLTQGRDPRDRVPAPSAGARLGADRDEGPGSSPERDDEPGDSPREDPADARGTDPGSPQDTGIARGRASMGRDDGDEGARAAGTGELGKRDWREPADLVAACLAAYDDDAGADSDDEAEDAGGEGGGGDPWPFSAPGPGKPGGRAPFPAKINLLVPVGTLLGWSDMPGEAGRDIIDPQALRDLVQASSHHPATRWCVTVLGADGIATAHGCARGQHPWNPPPGLAGTSQARDANTAATQATTRQERDGPPAGQAKSAGARGAASATVRQERDGRLIGQAGSAGARGAVSAAVRQERAGPPAGQVESASVRYARGTALAAARQERARPPTATQLNQLNQLLDQLKAAFEPIAKGTCDHRHREDRYRPSRALQDLVRARNATCPAPGCQASSAHADLDHTRAWPDGDTDECNLGTPCRHDHRLKQAPGWELTMPEPGFFRWKTPSGRVYNTGPTKYDT
jgi:hypothetical protein